METYQYFNTTDPHVKLLGTFEAESHEAARAKARAINPNYSAAPMPVLSRESGTRTVNLREDAADRMELYRELLKLSESLNPNAPDTLHAAFVQGRDSSGDPMEDAGRALGLEGAALAEFIKGRD